MKKPIVPKKKQMFQEETVPLQKIAGLIFSFPEVEFSVTEISNKAGVSKSSASRLIRHLEDAGIVTILDKRIVFRIKANMDNFQYIKRKIAYNLSTVYESGIVEHLNEVLNQPKAIILFGSYRKGDDVSTSDIDIAVETLQEIDTTLTKPKGIEEIGKKIGRQIQILVFSRKKVDINLFNNIANGIVLSGFLEVNP